MPNKYLLILTVGLGGVYAVWGPDLEPGPYCGKPGQKQCCDGRIDDCSHLLRTKDGKVAASKCYCDQFCNRDHEDCCPDYGPVCGNNAAEPTTSTTEPPPEPINDRGCLLDGKLYFRGQTTMKDCNICVCKLTDNRSNVTMECEQDQCIISEDVLRLKESDPYSTWYPEKYAQFAGKKLKEGRIYKLGTLPLDAVTLRMGPITYDKNIDYTEFDARKQWPRYISEVVDQGWCGSDWAVALTGVASDRYAISSNGSEQVVLSAQTLLSCNEKGQQGCNGGHVGNAWLFARTFGLVDIDCLPYEARRTICNFTKTSTLRQDGCKPLIPQRKKRYQVGPPGRLVMERDIMYDIMDKGPVFAIMEVYQDFFHYRHGVYRRSRTGDQSLQGLHSVRVVGWGQEGYDKYWIVANSWGPEWGENGYFRIARTPGVDKTFVFVISATAEVEVSLRK